MRLVSRIAPKAKVVHARLLVDLTSVRLMEINGKSRENHGKSVEINRIQWKISTIQWNSMENQGGIANSF